MKQDSVATCADALDTDVLHCACAHVCCLCGVRAECVCAAAVCYFWSRLVAAVAEPEAEAETETETDASEDMLFTQE